ncbi:TolC family protein [uncultured Azohydromonas sp.]|uniref:TolC family protein n=1 Tax=uncultured Azohydromonas sp. TaxID=487342 RepID=UPI002616CB8E|nr:TolC family protein [uncultured Azohydromonas sp.]
MRQRRWGIPSGLALAWMAACLPVHAQPTAAFHHDIRQGFEAAWARQPEARAAALRQAAVAAASQAARRWSPQPPALEINARSDRPHRNEGAREVEATVAVPLWLPGERSGTQAVASAEATLAQARIHAARWRVAEQVREAYWAHQRARLERELAQQRRGNALQLSADVARRVAAGELARADAHQAELAVAAADAAVSQAEVDLAQAAQRWAALVGAETVPGDTPAPEPMPPTLESEALHPALGELAARAESAARQRRLAAAQNRAHPELVLGTVRERAERAQPSSQSLIVGLRVPLGTQGDSAARVAAAGAEELEAQAALALEQDRVAAEVRAARARVQALGASTDAAERRARLAAELRGFIEKSFRAGESDLPARLRVELEAVEAERLAARARIDLAAAVSQLRQALGLLPE